MPAQVGIIYAKAVLDINEFNKRLAALEQGMKRLEGRTLRVDTKAAVRGLENLSNAFKAPTDAYNNLIEGLGRMGDKLTSLGMNLASFGYRMMLATSPLAAAGVASLKMATDLETSMALVATQLDLRGEDLTLFIDKFTKGFVDLSTEIPVAAKDMGDALYYLVSSMTIDPEVAAQFIEPIAKAAVAGQATAQMVAESITPILNVYQDLARTSEGVEHVLDVLFLTVKKGRGEFSDIAVQVGDFIQIAEQAGASFEEAMAAFAMATRVTTPAQAATWIANVYRSLVRPDAAEALDAVGIAIEQIVEKTGAWVTKTREQTESEREHLEALRETIRAMRERIGFAGARLGIGEEIWTRVQTYVETGELLPGVTISLANAYRKMGEAQAELNELLARGAESYQTWTGELERRPTLDIISDLAEHISTLSSEQEKLNVIWDVFPRMRGMQGAILFVENLAEIVEWEEEFAEATGLTQEAFEIMMGTFESKIGVLKNIFLALGFDLINEYTDDLKRLIDGLTDLFRAFRELPADVKGKVAMISGLLLLAGPAALVGSVLMMGGGMLISLIAALASLPSLVMLTGLGVLLGDKMPALLEALGAYGGGVSGFVTAIADLAVRFGILSETDAIGILETLGITVAEFDDEKIDGIAQGIEDIADAVSRGVDDLVEWKDAFGIFLEDVEKREGAVGTLVGYMERLVELLGDAYERLAPILGLPTEYPETPEAKAALIDRAMGFLIGTKLASFILGGLAEGLKTLAIVGVLLKGFGIVGGTATAGGAVAVAGSAVGVALAAAIGLALGGGLTAALLEAQTRIDEWFKRRFPELPPIFEREWMPEGPRTGEEIREATVPERLREDWEHFITWFQENVSGGPVGKVFYEVGRIAYENFWTPFKEGLTDYPSEEELFMRIPRDLEREFRAWGPLVETSIVAPFESADKDIQAILDRWGGKFDDVARDREPKIKPIFYDEAKLNEWMRNFRWLEGSHESVWYITEYIERRKGGEPTHLGGYPMHEGGYPPLNLPNVLADEFVLSPRTTDVLENYLGRLDQQKIRSAVTHAPIGMTINFFKGSVSSKEDAQEAADVIFDRIAERSRGLSLMET